MEKNNCRKKANIIFGKILGVSLVVFCVLFYAGYIFLSSVELIVGRIKETETGHICDCFEPFFVTDHPFLIFGLGIAGIVAVLYIFYSLFIFFKVFGSTANFIRLNTNKKKKNFSKKLLRAIKKANLDGTVVEIKDENPTIFCYGFIKPKVCISSKLAKKLTVNELIAVLCHEKGHVANKEPLKLLAIKTLTKMLFFIPILRHYSYKYAVFSELSADEIAIKTFKSKEHIISALLKILKMENEVLLRNSLAISFFNSTNDRVQRLMDDKYEPAQNISKKAVLTSIIAVILLFSVSYGLANDENANISSTGGSCDKNISHGRKENERLFGYVRDISCGSSCIMKLNDCLTDDNPFLTNSFDWQKI